MFGPVLMVAAGGVATDLLDDRKFLLCPAGMQEIGAAIAELRLFQKLKTLDSWPARVEELASAISTLSLVAVELRDVIKEFDVNPFVVSAHSITAVDALMITTAASAEAATESSQHDKGP